MNINPRISRPLFSASLMCCERRLTDLWCTCFSVGRESTPFGPLFSSCVSAFCPSAGASSKGLRGWKAWLSDLVLESQRGGTSGNDWLRRFFPAADAASFSPSLCFNAKQQGQGFSASHMKRKCGNDPPRPGKQSRSSRCLVKVA